MTIDRVEPTLFDDATDWLDERAARRDRFQADTLDEAEGRSLAQASQEPRAAPTAAAPTLPLAKRRVRADILANAAWYERHGKLGAAERARAIAEKLR